MALLHVEVKAVCALSLVMLSLKTVPVFFLQLLYTLYTNELGALFLSLSLSLSLSETPSFLHTTCIFALLLGSQFQTLHQPNQCPALGRSS